jgi:hypothetical protein
MAGYTLKTKFNQRRTGSPLRFDTPMSRARSVSDYARPLTSNAPVLDPGTGGGPPFDPGIPNVPLNPNHITLDPSLTIGPNGQQASPSGPQGGNNQQPLTFTPDEIQRMANIPELRPMLDRLIAAEQSGQVVLDNSATVDSGAASNASATVQDSGTVPDRGAAGAPNGATLDPGTGSSPTDPTIQQGSLAPQGPSTGVFGLPDQNTSSLTGAVTAPPPEPAPTGPTGAVGPTGPSAPTDPTSSTASPTTEWGPAPGTGSGPLPSTGPFAAPAPTTVNDVAPLFYSTPSSIAAGGYADYSPLDTTIFDSAFTDPTLDPTLVAPPLDAVATAGGGLTNLS